MTDYIICRPSFKDIFYLPDLFTEAVRMDFSFYEEAVKERIMLKNSLSRLFFAKLRKNRIIFVAKVEDTCVAVIIASFNAGIGVIHWVFVLPQYRKQKIASKLLQAAETEIEKAGCHKVTLTTEIAPDFYKNLGYSPEGLLKKHWWGKDFTILSKDLEEKKSKPVL